MEEGRNLLDMRLQNKNEFGIRKDGQPNTSKVKKNADDRELMREKSSTTGSSRT